MEKNDWVTNPAECFAVFLEKRDYSKKSCQTYKSVFNDLIEFLGKHNENLTTANERIFQEWMKTKPVSHNTGIRYLSFISSVLDEMFDDGAIDENFAKLLKEKKSKLKKGKTAKRLPVALDENEFNLLIAEIDKGYILPRVRIVVLILLSCGLRVDELCNLAVKDIHLDVEYPYLRVIGKADKEREVPIPDEVCNALEDHQSTLPDQNGFFIGVERKGKIDQYSPSGIFRMIQRLMSKAGIVKRRMSPHVLRHTYATRQLQGGVPIATLKMWMGHDSIATTMIYEHSVCARSSVRPTL